MQKLYGEADIAKERGVKPQTIQQERRRGKVPPPDYETVGGRPLWKRSTLVKAGVLNG